MEMPLELAQNYLRRRQLDLNELEKAILLNDYGRCQEIGHRIKGSATTFGFEDLAQLAATLEQDAQNEDLLSLASDVDKFKTWVNKYIS